MRIPAHPDSVPGLSGHLSVDLCFEEYLKWLIQAMGSTRSNRYPKCLMNKSDLFSFFVESRGGSRGADPGGSEAPSHSFHRSNCSDSNFTFSNKNCLIRIVLLILITLLYLPNITSKLCSLIMLVNFVLNCHNNI